MKNQIYRSSEKYRRFWRNARLVFLLIFIVVALVYTAKEKEALINPEGERGDIKDNVHVEENIEEGEPNPIEIESPTSGSAGDLDLNSIPEYSGVPTYVINGNKPDFTEEEIERAKSMFIDLSELDILGRCGTCTASLGKDTLAGERDFDLSHVKPSGWKQARYEDLIENGGFLWNRCHLIAFCISGLADTETNLITGSYYMNTSGMLSYSERATQNYIIRKLPEEGRILYRATPIFKGAELVCRGVHIEAADIPSPSSSPEECGQSFHINIYCYNVQPGVGIDYTTGESWRTER